MKNLMLTFKIKHDHFKRMREYTIKIHGKYFGRADLIHLFLFFELEKEEPIIIEKIEILGKSFKIIKQKQFTTGLQITNARIEIEVRLELQQL